MVKIVVSEAVRDYLSKRLTQVDDLVLRAAISLTEPDADGTVVVQQQTLERLFDAISFCVSDFVAENKE